MIITNDIPRRKTTAGERLSASSIRRYQQCPKAYWLSDVERLGAPPSSPTLAQGNAIHDALSLFYGLPDDARSSENLTKALRACWKRYRSVFENEEQEIAHGKDALHLLSVYAENADLHVRPLARERWVKATLPSGQLINGKLDRVDINETGQLDVMDYKTGKRMLSAEELALDIAARVYAFLASGSFAVSIHRLRWIYLRFGQEVVWEPTFEELHEVKDWLISQAETIATDSNFAAKPGRHCQWCPHQLRCDEREATTLADLEVDEEVPF